jgi:hypothetical protein
MWAQTFSLTSVLEGGECLRQASAILTPGNRHGTHCTGGWVVRRAGLDAYGKSRPHSVSIPGPSSP